jgi:phage recombination protein Bet
MNTDLAKIKNSQLNMWEDKEKLEEMKKIICKVKLTELEFSTFIEMGRSTNLNPFLREIWVVKYDEKSPASIFIGRDGYRKAAQRDPEYDYHQCDAVFENDKFSVIDGVPKHEYTLTNRGELIGAYCIAKRHKSSRPVYVFALLSEYSTGKSLWNPQTGKQATMIKKVAESQCLRMCFQDLLGGSYAPEERDIETVVIDVDTGAPLSKSDMLMNKLKSAKGQTIDVQATPSDYAAPAEPQTDTGECASDEVLSEIHHLISTKEFDGVMLKKSLDHYKVETMAQLTSKQADHFIGQLGKVPDKEE